jgi:trehalose 6-phosphate synthase
MSLEERRQRWQALFDRLCEEDAASWARSFMDTLRQVH